jgi:hypothetical protein
MSEKTAAWNVRAIHAVVLEIGAKCEEKLQQVEKEAQGKKLPQDELEKAMGAATFTALEANERRDIGSALTRLQKLTAARGVAAAAEKPGDVAAETAPAIATAEQAKVVEEAPVGAQKEREEGEGTQEKLAKEWASLQRATAEALRALQAEIDEARRTEESGGSAGECDAALVTLLERVAKRASPVLAVQWHVLQGALPRRAGATALTAVLHEKADDLKTAFAEPFSPRAQTIFRAAIERLHAALSLENRS